MQALQPPTSAAHTKLLAAFASLARLISAEWGRRIGGGQLQGADNPLPPIPKPIPKLNIEPPSADIAATLSRPRRNSLPRALTISAPSIVHRSFLLLVTVWAGASNNYIALPSSRVKKKLGGPGSITANFARSLPRQLRLQLRSRSSESVCPSGRM